MGKRGRRTQPTVYKLARGNPGKGRSTETSQGPLIRLAIVGGDRRLSSGIMPCRFPAEWAAQDSNL
jgi:hypothetical protein